jgi:DNA-binding response OmpR family regulator
MTARILIVDDEPNIVIPLEYLMRREGYDVATAGDGEAALQAVAERPPDLVILDVMLPRMSGFDVCRALRMDPRHGRLKILMLSAKGRESEVEKGLAVGADAYVTKPFSTRDLVVRVRNLLGGAS